MYLNSIYYRNKKSILNSQENSEALNSKKKKKKKERKKERKSRKRRTILTTHIFKTYYKVKVTKTFWSKPMQQNREPRNKLSYRDAKTIQWRQVSFFNKWFWGNWISIWERMRLDHHFIPHIKTATKNE